MDPFTPENTPPRPHFPGIPGTGVRRSFTAPTTGSLRPSFTAGSPLAESNASQGDIETITTYNDAKIVKLENVEGLGSSRGKTDSAGTLPWTVPTERTQAAGPLSIYRVKSSGVCFLNSGKFLLSIFPRSQCWCVDGESIFVMPMRGGYYRIELSVKTEEDKAGVEEFKQKIGTVLLYEKTPCPFKRGFHVELPEQPKTPARKMRIGDPNKKAKRWTLDRVWRPEGADGPAFDHRTDSSGHSSETTQGTEEEEDDEETKNEEPENRVDSVLGDSPCSRQEIRAPLPGMPETARPFQNAVRSLSNRSITVPPMLQLQQARFFRPEPAVSEPTPAPLQPISPPTKPSYDPETASLSSIDSFYSISDSQSLPPFLEPPANIELPADLATPRQPSHRRDDSAITVTSSNHSATFPPTRFSEDNALPSPPFSPGHPLPPAYRTTSTTSTSSVWPPHSNGRPSIRRSHSPLPHPSNIALPSHTSSTLVSLVGSTIAGKLTRGLIRLLLGPPAGLVALMVRVAKRIVEGTADWGVVDTRDIFGEVDDQVGGWQSDDEDEEWAEMEEEDAVLVVEDERNDSTRRRHVPVHDGWEAREDEAIGSGADVD